MNKRELELLEIVKSHKKEMEPEKFSSWLRGFMSLGNNTDRFVEEVERVQHGKPRE